MGRITEIRDHGRRKNRSERIRTSITNGEILLQNTTGISIRGVYYKTGYSIIFYNFDNLF